MFYKYKSNLYTCLKWKNNKFFKDTNHGKFKYQDEKQGKQEDNIDILSSNKSLQVFKIVCLIRFILNQQEKC